MHLRAPAIIVAIRPHGESGAIVRALTAEAGLLAGYVRGGRSRQHRPVLQPGNDILGDWRARTEDQLPALVAELTHSRAPLFREPLPAAAIDWATALTAAALPEGQTYPPIHAALGGLLDAIEAAPAARGWAVAMVRYELLLLALLGFGLDLDQCVATGGTEDLAFVSPKSGMAVSTAAAVGYEARLFRLPPFLREGGAAEWDDILDGLRLTGHFLERDLLHGKAAEVLAARERLVDRINRAVA
ncbi:MULTISPECIES: DNA repair protein RecO [unclassified Sphingomonas]|uniref:DNA repair protein RecO n=1 Tax=unclassified Sphingomonas TaxID=196159 RepID=UPI0021508FA4|nr:MULTISPECIES: DNA repair protein RecO [unclassified Sphingomonas]MCR5871515.1 DNA repair protein RecO [Sphingomonas sp. J344]UUY00190.1 DNA repair protein RecO [Sphingomonas sp. J315]